jgi:hypothetical protein
MIGMYRFLRAQFSSENIEPPLVGKLTRQGFQRAIICLPQSSFSQVLLITRYAGRTQLAAEAVRAAHINGFPGDFCRQGRVAVALAPTALDLLALALLNREQDARHDAPDHAEEHT